MNRFIFILLGTMSYYTNCTGQKTAIKEIITIPENTIIDSLVVIKSERKLIVFSNTIEIKTYQIALGKNPVGKKRFEGDLKTPEGLYFIDAKSTTSSFHKNMNISYPNDEDIKFAAAHHKPAGGDIKIHGLPNGYNEKDYVISDWTLGCIALTNTEVDELFRHIKLGSPILILP